ncbi:hypothetical protein P8452_42772 [Trifolium repens]|nr:hypothetical protein P8452_42772 [Trifolium repens]
MLMDLGSSVYDQEFETHFLQVLAEFYRAESQKFIECCDCGDYLKKAERFLNEEMDRLNHYLDPRMKKKITNVMEKEMIENHMLGLIHMENYGLVNMLCDGKYEDLSRMYNLFGRVTDGHLKFMFGDMKTSLDSMQGFYASYSELVDGPTLNVTVQTTGFWPTQSSVTCNLPDEILALCEKFRSYYLGSHTGRRLKLSWQTKMGTADLKATFRKATEIPTSDLKRCLQSLASVKGRNVLRKEPMSKDVSEDDVFFVNDKFSSKLYKVKIGTFVAAKESEPEKLETQQKVEEHRKPQIDATIVRIMESRKQLDHNHLIAEVTIPRKSN